MDRDRAGEVFGRLAATYPDARCELDFAGPFQLLVATVLSAQSTDVRVNMVTPGLFARYPTPEAMAAADRDNLEDLIRSTGFFRNKATSLLGLSRAIADDYDGVVPVDIDALVALPGVGRKTANVVRGHAFGLPAITTDTHVLRVSARLGWSSAKNPEVVEQQVGDLFDPSVWTQVSDTLIFHGRRCCHAKKAACGACPVGALCPGFGAGVTDPAAAARLIRQ